MCTTRGKLLKYLNCVFSCIFTVYYKDSNKDKHLRIILKTEKLS